MRINTGPIYDPTEQIRQSGRDVDERLRGYQAQQKEAFLQRQKMVDNYVANIQGIKDEAVLMHKDFMQEEVDKLVKDSTANMITTGLFGVPLDRNTDTQRKIQQLKKFNANSKYLQDSIGKYADLASKDKYMTDQLGFYNEMNTIMADKDLLMSLNPTEVESKIYQSYNSRRDNKSLIFDKYLSKIKSQAVSTPYSPEGSDETRQLTYSVPSGVFTVDEKTKKLAYNKDFVKEMVQSTPEGSQMKEEQVEEAVDYYESLFETGVKDQILESDIDNKLKKASIFQKYSDMTSRKSNTVDRGAQLKTAISSAYSGDTNGLAEMFGNGAKEVDRAAIETSIGNLNLDRQAELEKPTKDQDQDKLRKINNETTKLSKYLQESAESVYFFKDRDGNITSIPKYKGGKDKEKFKSWAKEVRAAVVNSYKGRQGSDDDWVNLITKGDADKVVDEVFESTFSKDSEIGLLD